MPTLSKHVLVIVVFILTTVCWTAPVRAQRTASHRHHRHHRDSHTTHATKVAKKRVVPTAKTTVVQEQPSEGGSSLLSTVLSILGCLLLVCAPAGACMLYFANHESQPATSKDTYTMTREFLATTRSADGVSSPRASGISADLQKIALEYTQVTGKGLFGGHSELLRQNTQGALEAKGVDAAVRRLDNRDRIVNRLAQSIRAEDQRGGRTLRRSRARHQRQLGSAAGRSAQERRDRRGGTGSVARGAVRLPRRRRVPARSAPAGDGHTGMGGIPLPAHLLHPRVPAPLSAALGAFPKRRALIRANGQTVELDIVNVSFPQDLPSIQPCLRQGQSRETIRRTERRRQAEMERVTASAPVLSTPTRGRGKSSDRTAAAATNMGSKSAASSPAPLQTIEKQQTGGFETVLATIQARQARRGGGEGGTPTGTQPTEARPALSVDKINLEADAHGTL